MPIRRQQRPAQLEKLDLSKENSFKDPAKQINDGPDVSIFHSSLAYSDIVAFLLQLNASMFPRKLDQSQHSAESWELGNPAIEFSSAVQNLRSMLARLHDMIAEAPVDTGPRRFGNISFRKWLDLVDTRAIALLQEYLPSHVVSLENGQALQELKAYLLGSFGSGQRLDYGTGHELSFLAFIGGIWKLSGFADVAEGVEERGIVTGVVQPYLELVRTLIKTYTLEPAGSHGVWGLDDHCFLPYIFGSAQLGYPISSSANIPSEGSLLHAPDPGDVGKQSIVERHRNTNMYFSAVGFIYDVKRGPFWEHSPMLWDISGVSTGWSKINKGMLKMYMVEVLSKFPVVQHFYFGSLFKWEHDPNAPLQAGVPDVPSQTTSQTSAAAKTQAKQRDIPSASHPESSTAFVSTVAPWATPRTTFARGLTRDSRGARAPAQTSLPDRTRSSQAPPMSGTRAPWAANVPNAASNSNKDLPMQSTRAPWAKD